MAYQAPVTVRRALERIHHHDYVLPSIQREFVWSTDQICQLFDSLLRGYPIGTFLFWKVDAERSRDFTFYDVIREYHEVKANHSPLLSLPEPRALTAILDGQQRLSALNIGLCGSHATKLPHRRSNNPDAYPTRHLFLDLCFVPDETDADLEVRYRFEFLTDADAQRMTSPDRHWYRVADVLDLREGPTIFQYVQQAGLAEHPSAFFALDALWRGVHQHPSSTFTKRRSNPSRRFSTFSCG